MFFFINIFIIIKKLHEGIFTNIDRSLYMCDIKNIEKKKEKVVPGIEPGLLVSETRVIAITLHNQFF